VAGGVDLQANTFGSHCDDFLVSKGDLNRQVREMDPKVRYEKQINSVSGAIQWKSGRQRCGQSLRIIVSPAPKTAPRVMTFFVGFLPSGPLNPTHVSGRIH
jgi:hypothetical protein